MVDYFYIFSFNSSQTEWENLDGNNKQLEVPSCELVLFHLNSTSDVPD